MTPIEALLISIELLREAHKRLYAANEMTLATELAHTLFAARERLSELRIEHAR